jgi:hypothetical protein
MTETEAQVVPDEPKPAASLLDIASKIATLGILYGAVTYALGAAVLTGYLRKFGVPMSGLPQYRFFAAGTSFLFFGLCLPSLIGIISVLDTKDDRPLNVRRAVIVFWVMAAVALLGSLTLFDIRSSRWVHTLLFLVPMFGASAIAILLQLRAELNRSVSHLSWMRTPSVWWVVFIMIPMLFTLGEQWGESEYSQRAARVGGWQVVRAEFVIGETAALSLSYGTGPGRGVRLRKLRGSTPDTGNVSLYRTPLLRVLEEDAETYFILTDEPGKQTRCIRFRKSDVVSLRYDTASR